MRLLNISYDQDIHLFELEKLVLDLIPKLLI